MVRGWLGDGKGNQLGNQLGNELGLYSVFKWVTSGFDNVKKRIPQEPLFEPPGPRF